MLETLLGADELPAYRSEYPESVTIRVASATAE
jgi:hypothetical protein